jgi:hypothetical protein
VLPGGRPARASCSLARHGRDRWRIELGRLVAAVGRQHLGLRQPGVLVVEHILRDIQLRAVLLARVAAATHFQPARERILAAAARHQVLVRLGGLPVGAMQHTNRAAGPDTSQRVLDKLHGQPTRGAIRRVGDDVIGERGVVSKEVMSAAPVSGPASPREMTGPFCFAALEFRFGATV